MFDRGNILYIENYQLSSNKLKNKYLLVLENLDNEAIIISLPTSQQYLDQVNIKKGAIEQGQTKGYHFPKNDIVGKNGFSFDLDTYVLFRSNVFKESIDVLLSKYPSNDITIKDTLTDKEYRDLIYAMYKSGTLRPNIEDLFETILDSISE